MSVTVVHTEKGELTKQNIVYMENGKELTREFYTGNAEDIRPGYEPEDGAQPVRKVPSADLDAFIDSLSPEQIIKLKSKLA